MLHSHSVLPPSRHEWGFEEEPPSESGVGGRRGCVVVLVELEAPAGGMRWSETRTADPAMPPPPRAECAASFTTGRNEW